jgi:CRP-like cAMP-binding protein
MEPGAVFGELSVLLDKLHTADVRALETPRFRVADASALLDPIALLYMASVLARRLNSANQTLVGLRRQIKAGASRAEIGKTVEKMEGLLGVDGASLIYAGYPYDPARLKFRTRALPSMTISRPAQTGKGRKLRN